MQNDERVDEDVLQCFGHAERMENDRIAKRIYVGEGAGIRSVGCPQKKWIDTIKGYLRKRGLNIRQTRKMVQDKRNGERFVMGNAWGVALG